MSRPNYEYLELACYGMTCEQVARRYGRSPQAVRLATIRAARIVGRLGPWKFDVPSRDFLDLMAPKLLEKMDRHGLRTSRKEAA